MSDPMEDLVEAVARALVDDHRLRNREPRITDEAWAEIRSTSFGLPSWSHFASQARAAISAINGSGIAKVADAKTIKRAWIAGFAASAEGWNGEYPHNALQRVDSDAADYARDAMISAVEG